MLLLSLGSHQPLQHLTVYIRAVGLTEQPAQVAEISGCLIRRAPDDGVETCTSA